MKRKNRIEFGRVVRAEDLKGDDPKDTRLLQEMLSEAREFLLSQEWCSSLEEEYFGIGIGGIVAVFLFRIQPKRKGIDDWLWVVVGDLPTAYLVTDVSPTPVDALHTYVGEMSKWVGAVRARKPVARLIPVNVPATKEWAEGLQKRLDFLKAEILPSMQ
jgi:hypothetical protein